MALPQAVAAVERHLGEAALVALVRDEVVVVLQLVERVPGDVPGRVELTGLERGDHRVGVVELAHHDRVHGRLATPIVGVGLEARELALLELLEHEGPRAHAVLPLVLITPLRAQLAPDVLGQEVHVHRRQLGVRHRSLDNHRPRIRRRGGEVRGDRGMVEPLLLARRVDVPHDVLGGEWLAVRPLQPVAKLVGPGELVLGPLPRLRQAGDGREVVGRLVRQRGVHHVPRLVVGDEDAHQRAHAVDSLRFADVERDRPLLAARRYARQPGDQDQEQDRSGQSPSDVHARVPPWLQTQNLARPAEPGASGRATISHQMPVEEALEPSVEVELGPARRRPCASVG